MKKKVAIRSIIVAPTGKVLIQCDLSQAETWIVAFLANEPNMKWSLMYSDIHSDTASVLHHFDKPCPSENNKHKWKKVEDDARFCQVESCGVIITKESRYTGKRVNHGTSYRMGYQREAEVINKDSDKPPYVIVTVAETKLYQERWHSYYHIKGWWSRIEEQLNRNRTLITAYARQRTFYAAWGNELFKEATAFEPQSTVADHCNGVIHRDLGIPGGLREVYRQLVLPYNENKIVNQSHDSFILEVPYTIHTDIAERAKKLLTRPLVINDEEFTIPVDCEVGERWNENMRKVV